MNKNFLKLIGIVALTALAQGARSELKWEQTSVDLKPALGDKQAVAHFKYENVGKTPVHFKSVHASCANTSDGEYAGDQVYPFHDPTRPGHTSGDSSVTQSITGERGPTSAIAHCARPCARNRRGDLFSQ